VEVFLLALLLLMDTCDAPPCPNTYIHTPGILLPLLLIQSFARVYIALLSYLPMPSLNVCIYVLGHGGASHVSIKSNRARRNTSTYIEGIGTFAPHLASFYSTALSRGEVP
jgi:hypothetical protein